MGQFPLLDFLRRISWLLAFLLGAFFAFLICDLFSGSYQSGAENFFEWGWIWVIIFTLIVKKVFLSEEIISNISLENIVSLPPSPTISPVLQDSSIDITESFPVIAIKENVPTNQTHVAMNDKEEHIQEIISKPTVVLPPPEPEEPSWIVTFFSDRPLAKIGGIILFLGAFFFLSLVWSNVGAIGKVIIGLIFGFSLYGIGVWMDKKGHIAESRTLLGVGIAINTLTILSGRWIIGDDSGNIFSDTLTLVFLVLNTLFAVVTGLVYNSRTFLVFSFIFAYFIPFIVRSESDSSILMILYTATISLGGYLLTWLFQERNERGDDMKWLFRTIIIGSLILLSLTGFGVNTQSEFISLALITLILTSVGIIISRKTELKDESVPSLIISAYIVLGCSILGIGDGNQGSIFITFLSILPLMIVTGFFMIGATVAVYSWILLIPLILSLLLFGIFGAQFLVFILVPVVFLYGLSGFFLLPVMTGLFQYVFFLAIASFLFICSLALDRPSVDLSSGERFIISMSSLGFFLLSLWASHKNKLSQLALVSLISSSIIFVVSLIPEWSASWIFYILFLLVAFSYPFFHRQSIKEQFSTFIAYQVVLNLFMIGELFYLGRNTWFTGESNSLITLGIIVFLLSIFSLGYSLILIRSTLSDEQLSTLSNDAKRNATALLGIPLSLFTLAIAVTFSESPLVVSTAWILESVILAYYSAKEKNQGILIGTIVLAFIGVLRLIPFFDSLNTGAYFALVPITIIALGLYFSLIFIPDRDRVPLGNLYDIVHIFGISMVAYALMEIIPHTRTGWSLLGLNIFLLLSTWFYTKISSKIISFWMVFLSIVIFFYHLARVESLSMEFGSVLIQLSALAIGSFAVWYMKTKHIYGKYAFIYAFIMFLLITSIYVNQITDNIFAVTIYLTVIASIYLLLGINENIPKYRSIGLYIGSIVLLKILMYDIWAGVDNLIIRVVALMITGGLMIAISQLYGRRVNRSWSEEFDFSNFLSPSSSFGSQNEDTENDESPTDPEDMPFDEVIASDLKKYNIHHIASIELQDTNGDILLTSRRAGIIRVANYIIQSLGKSEFAPSELEKVLEKVLPHIKSSLPPKELENMLMKIYNWIKKGGKIVIKGKN